MPTRIGLVDMIWTWGGLYMKREDCFDEMRNGWDEIMGQQRLMLEKWRKMRTDAQKYLMNSTFENKK